MDVETLMGLIRRRVNGPPDARHIMGEIERARLKADSIVTGRIGESLPKANGDPLLKVDEAVPPRPTRRGWKSRLKGSVVLLIMRAVRMNFRYQEHFNNSVISVLQLVAEDLYEHERRFGVTGQQGGYRFCLSSADFCTSTTSRSNSSTDAANYPRLSPKQALRPRAVSARSIDLTQPFNDLLGALSPGPPAQHLSRGPRSFQPRLFTILIDVAHQRAQVLVRRLGPLETLVVGAPGLRGDEPLDARADKLSRR